MTSSMFGSGGSASSDDKPASGGLVSGPEPVVLGDAPEVVVPLAEETAESPEVETAEAEPAEAEPVEESVVEEPPVEEPVVPEIVLPEPVVPEPEPVVEEPVAAEPEPVAEAPVEEAPAEDVHVIEDATVLSAGPVTGDEPAPVVSEADQVDDTGPPAEEVTEPTGGGLFSMDTLGRLWSRSGVFWRHDVDFSLECAVKMARLERAENISSVYYLRAHADGYQLDSDEFRAAVKDLVRYGQKLGVHVDLGLPRDADVSDQQILTACKEQVSQVVAALPAGGFLPVRVSFHAPPLDALWRDVDGYAYAMTPEWGGRYLADSRGVFNRDLDETLKVRGPLQVNLHPEWWFLSESDADALRAQEAAKP